MAKLSIDKMMSKKDTGEKDTSDRLDKMSEAIRNVCTTLSGPNNTFDVKKAFDSIKDYVNTYDRLLYADISTHCFGLSTEQMDNFQGNMHQLVEYTYSWNYENGIKSLTKQNNEQEIELRGRAKRAILKMYDHVNLACTQVISLKRSEEELHAAVVKEFSPLKQEITEDMSAQLITLVGIFTALAFLVFGGFSALTGLFENIATEEVARIVLLASLWGLVICNGLFVFMYCVERITKKDKEQKQFGGLPAVQWTNLGLLTSTLLSTWLLFVDERNIGGWFIKLIKQNDVAASLAGLGFILLFFVIGAIWIAHKSSAKR